MTAFTPNSGGIVNFDTLAGGSVNATLDTYTISNKTTLLIDTDTYQCANHSTAAGSLDTVSFSGTGGTLKIDGTNVRVIPYNTGTGNVPTIGTTISQGGVSGTLLGVWANWLSEPTTVGLAMPATGFIKIKGKTGGNFAAGALTGIGATATGPDVVGWIEVRGADTAQITVPRIGKFQVTGDWFELGTTNGSRGQILACPTCATTAGTLPGVWIETAPGSDVYERYPAVGSMVALSSNPTDERGKVVWHTTTGFRIGSDGTNNVGYLPASGCRVRVPNVFLHCCTRSVSGSGARVSPSTTNTIAASTRQEFVTTGAGDIDIQYANVMWNAYFLQAYKTVIKHSAFNDYLQVLEIAAPLDLDDIIISPNLTAIVYAAFTITSCFGGGTVKNVTGEAFSLAASGRYAANLSYVTGVAFENVRIGTLLNRGHATTGCWQNSYLKDCTFTECGSIGGRMLFAVGNQNITVTNYHYANQFSGTTGTTFTHGALEFSAGNSNILIDGVDFYGLTNCQCYGAVVWCNAPVYNLTLRNLGGFAAKRDLGATNGAAYILQTTGNCDGIRVQRCYVSNTRTGPLLFLNSDTNITIESVFPDYADTTIAPALNMVIKGGGWNPGTTGQVSVYGTHWQDYFTSTTVGRIELLCNEPTAASAAQCSVTAGTPFFNSSGQVALTTVGDQVTWEMPYFAKGHTSFQNVAPTLTGTNTGNLTYEFQYDIGAGYNGSWLTLNATNLNAVGAITAATGVKLKVRATCATAAAGNLLTNIRIATNTDSTSQNQTYPLDTFTLTLTGLPTGCDVVVLSAGTSTILAQQDSLGATSYGYTYESPHTVDIGIIKPGYVPYYIRNLSLGSASSSLPISLTPDRNYAA